MNKNFVTQPDSSTCNIIFPSIQGKKSMTTEQVLWKQSPYIRPDGDKILELGELKLILLTCFMMLKTSLIRSPGEALREAGKILNLGGNSNTNIFEYLDNVPIGLLFDMLEKGTKSELDSVIEAKRNKNAKSETLLSHINSKYLMTLNIHEKILLNPFIKPHEAVDTMARDASTDRFGILKILADLCPWQTCCQTVECDKLNVEKAFIPVESNCGIYSYYATFLRIHTLLTTRSRYEKDTLPDLDNVSRTQIIDSWWHAN